MHNTLAAVFATTKKSEEEIERITEKAREDMRKRGASGHNYFNEKRGGLTISDRVWNISDTARNEIETIIQNGILEGKNPDQIAKSVQPYLREPHKLFRRVRNKETGELELSQAAKKYKPGRGVYRSAYKNAMRLARTEVTAAYRRAEWETYQNNPLITGFRIELSNNHTTLVKGVPVPFHDICDEMVGVYPKTFLWTGWHPQCRCRMIPVFISKADFKDRMKALAAGKLKDWKPKSTVTDMPENFKKWIQDNSDRIAAARALPYWMQNNQGTINSILNITPATGAAAAKPFTMTTQNAKNVIKKGFNIEGDLDNYDNTGLERFNIIEFDKDFEEVCKEYGVNITERRLEIMKKTGYVYYRYEREGETGSFLRAFGYSNKGKTAAHMNFDVPEKIQGKGFARKTLQAFVKQYQKAGVKRISLAANKDIGGYAWARYGLMSTRRNGHDRVYRSNLLFKIQTGHRKIFQRKPNSRIIPNAHNSRHAGRKKNVARNHVDGRTGPNRPSRG